MSSFLQPSMSQQPGNVNNSSTADPNVSDLLKTLLALLMGPNQQQKSEQQPLVSHPPMQQFQQQQQAQQAQAWPGQLQQPQRQNLLPDANVNNLLLQLIQQVGTDSFQNSNNSANSASSSNGQHLGLPMVSNANSQLPITGLAQLQNMNSVDQLKLMLLRNMSPTERQRLFGQQQQQQFRTPMRSSLGQMQSSAGVGSNMSGDILQRLEQFTNRDRTERSGLSVVSESDRSSSSNGSTSVAVGQGGAVDRSYPMQDIEYPGQNDCMFGRGGGTSNHIGNINFRLLIEKFKKKYAAASKIDKPKVTDEVVSQWRARKPPGRFLTRTDPDDSMSKWHDVGDKRARRKCAQALREKQSRCWNESCEQEPDEPVAKRHKGV